MLVLLKFLVPLVDINTECVKNIFHVRENLVGAQITDCMDVNVQNII